VLYNETIFDREDTEIELGAELIKSVPQEIIGGGDADIATANLYHAHAVGDGDRHIEDMLERTTIQNHIETFGKLARNRTVEVMNVDCAFVIRGVERADVLGSERAKERFRVVHSEGRSQGRIQTELTEIGGYPVNTDVDSLTTKTGHALERYAVSP
jgi:hypothetical protein